MTIVSGIFVQLDECAVEIAVTSDRPVAEEDDTRGLLARPLRHGVDRGRLQLDQVEVASLRRGTVKILPELAPAGEGRRADDRLDALARDGTCAVQRDARVRRHVLRRLRAVLAQQ